MLFVGLPPSKLHGSRDFCLIGSLMYPLTSRTVPDTEGMLNKNLLNEQSDIAVK
jgi:hypothetical protein